MSDEQRGRHKICNDFKNNFSPAVCVNQRSFFDEISNDPSDTNDVTVPSTILGNTENPILKMENDVCKSENNIIEKSYGCISKDSNYEKNSDFQNHERPKPYKRHNKPPHSYITLIAMAIRDSETKRQTLAEINDYLQRHFDFFRGPYTGWRNSIRHNLSLNECFVKVLRDPARPWGKDNYWMINPLCDYAFVDGVFRRVRRPYECRKNDECELDDGNSYYFEKIPNKSPNKRHSTHSAPCKFSSSFTIDNLLKTPQTNLNEKMNPLKNKALSWKSPVSNPPKLHFINHTPENVFMINAIYGVLPCFMYPPVVRTEETFNQMLKNYYTNMYV